MSSRWPSIPIAPVLRLIVGRKLFIPVTMADERRVGAMTEPDSTEAGSNDLVTALSPKQLAYLVVFIGFVVLVTRARRRAGRL
jgi:hypothetical protein